MRDIDENTVCIVYIHATGELVAKRIVENANTLTLKASGGGISDKEYSPDEVEVRAIVLKVQFDIDKQIARAQEARIRSNGIGRRKKDELTPRLWNNEEIPY